jgi:hypothetical protein
MKPDACPVFGFSIVDFIRPCLLPEAGIYFKQSLAAVSGEETAGCSPGSCARLWGKAQADSSRLNCGAATAAAIQERKRVPTFPGGIIGMPISVNKIRIAIGIHGQKIFISGSKFLN